MNVYQFDNDAMYCSRTLLIASDNKANAVALAEKINADNYFDNWYFSKQLPALKASGKNTRVVFRAGHSE